MRVGDCRASAKRREVRRKVEEASGDLIRLPHDSCDTYATIYSIANCSTHAKTDRDEPEDDPAFPKNRMFVVGVSSMLLFRCTGRAPPG